MDQNPVRNKWLVIINPNAGNGKGKRDWEKISFIMKEEALSFTEKFTEGKGHAIKLTIEGIEAGFRKIISVGGDGTLNEVVNGVFSCNTCHSRDVSLAMIPVGTGNDWGRMFGIPLDYEKAIKVIVANNLLLHDIGTMNYYFGTEERKRYFINIAGLGFESEVVRRTNIQKDRGRSNKAIYFYNLLLSLISYKNTRAEAVIDGKKTFADVFSISIGNGRFCGGGMRQTPNALPDDGLLDVTIINGMGKLEIIGSLKMLYDGSILNHPKVDNYRCKNIRISSDILIGTQADGELLGHTPVEFGIIPEAINIVFGTRISQ